MTSLRQPFPLCLFLTLVLAAPICTAGGPSPGAPSTVVASQGGAIVTLEDLDAFANGIPEAQRAGFFNSPTRIENLITQLLLQKQLAAEARANGLDKTPLVRKQVALAEEDALGKARMQQVRDDLKLPDFDELAQEEYQAHKESHVVHGTLDVEHILIGTGKRSEAEAKALAETVEKEAIAHPDRFEALVEKYSDDPSKADNHGLMHDAGDSKKYVREFAEAASALKKPGDLSPIVKTSYGFHILKLVKRTADRTPTFADVKKEILAKLRSDYLDKQVKLHADTLRNLPLDANAELVASLRTRYLDASKSAPDGGGQK